MKRQLGAAAFQALWDLGPVGRVVILVFLGVLFVGFAYVAIRSIVILHSRASFPNLAIGARVAPFGSLLVFLALSALMGFNLVRVANNWITGAASPF